MRPSILLLLLTLASCSHDRRDPAEVYRGTCLLGFEKSDFTPEGSPLERWWLSGEVGELSSRIGTLDTPAVVTLEGRLSERGAFGHLGSYGRELRVTRVLEVRVVGAEGN